MLSSVKISQEFSQNPKSFHLIAWLLFLRGKVSIFSISVSHDGKTSNLGLKTKDGKINLHITPERLETTAKSIVVYVIPSRKTNTG